MKQYAFTPVEHDPHIEAANQWEAMREELNLTREALEAANANEVTHAALIDMLRKELTATKEQWEIDRAAIIVMRTKLKASALVLIDALKADAAGPEHQPEPEPPKRRLQDLPSVRKEPTIVRHTAPAVDEPPPMEETESLKPRPLINGWP